MKLGLSGVFMEHDETHTLVEVTTEQEAYRDLLNLRFRELRVPLGLTWSVDDLKWEQLERHFGMRLGEIWVGVCVVRELSGKAVKIRQVAIASEYQGQHFGWLMMAQLLKLLGEEGVAEVEIHARKNVIGFYKKLGFQCQGPEFEEIGIRHRKMTRELEPV
ncbi:MAG: GNAT family N-acetyltransferase [Akkermansiaceae bacterium]